MVRIWFRPATELLWGAYVMRSLGALTPSFVRPHELLPRCFKNHLVTLYYLRGQLDADQIETGDKTREGRKQSNILNIT